MAYADLDAVAGLYMDYTDYIKKSEFAAVFGAGVERKLSKAVLSIEARCHLGLTEALTDAFIANNGTFTSMKHKGISVMVGIGF